MALYGALMGSGEPVAGPWRAWLDSPGGELPFGLEIQRGDSVWRAWLINPPERTAVPKVGVSGDTLTLDIDHYDARIVATIAKDGKRLDGTWRKRGRGDAWVELPFHAEAGAHPRFAHSPKETTTAALGAIGVTGRWSVSFSGSEQPAIGVFHSAPDGSVTGTILTATGDYRFLAGRFDSPRLRLSTFDGAHAFLFDARMQSDGTLSGDFWSRDAWHETWSAKRDDEAKLPDGFERVTPGRAAALAEVTVRDLDGRPRTLAEAGPKGAVRLIELFGTWCPNCHDASAYLAELDERYRGKGLIVVGLAFEYDDDLARSVSLVKRFAERHQARYEMLVAGTTDKERIAKLLPFLAEFKAYPTLVLIDRSNRVRAIYSGFAGPATGEDHLRLRKTMESIIEELLAE